MIFFKSVRKETLDSKKKVEQIHFTGIKSEISLTQKGKKPT